ncbi:hypothetical protein [Nonomuraea sp. B19D2]|uniref:hypothetical protein n=1 Tax=Nonomuraea sp. B19D2 TaxID=3159561 RepID=UPI0032DA471F
MANSGGGASDQANANGANMASSNTSMNGAYLPGVENAYAANQAGLANIPGMTPFGPGEGYKHDESYFSELMGLFNAPMDLATDVEKTTRGINIGYPGFGPAFHLELGSISDHVLAQAADAWKALSGTIDSMKKALKDGDTYYTTAEQANGDNGGNKDGNGGGNGDGKGINFDGGGVPDFGSGVNSANFDPSKYGANGMNGLGNTGINPGNGVGDIGNGINPNSNLDGLTPNTSDMPTPGVNTPDMPTPGMNTPDIPTPDVNTPGMNTPDIPTPDVNTPGINTPGMNTDMPKVDPNVARLANANPADFSTPNISPTGPARSTLIPTGIEPSVGTGTGVNGGPAGNAASALRGPNGMSGMGMGGMPMGMMPPIGGQQGQDRNKQGGPQLVGEESDYGLDDVPSLDGGTVTHET